MLESFIDGFIDRQMLSTGVQPQMKSWRGPRFGSQHWSACTPRPAK